jgi:hydroxymethylpyrimidine/phosphomethylpyrimidine kinase
VGKGEESAIRNPQSEIVTDVLFVDGEVLVFEVPRVDTTETHGPGCTFSAAITAFLALGESTGDAVRKAGLYVADVLGKGSRKSKVGKE